MEFDKPKNMINQTHGVKKLNISDTMYGTYQINFRVGIWEFEELHLNLEIRDTIRMSFHKLFTPISGTR